MQSEKSDSKKKKMNMIFLFGKQEENVSRRREENVSGRLDQAIHDEQMLRQPSPTGSTSPQLSDLACIAGSTTGAGRL